MNIKQIEKYLIKKASNISEEELNDILPSTPIISSSAATLLPFQSSSMSGRAQALDEATGNPEESNSFLIKNPTTSNILGGIGGATLGGLINILLNKYISKSKDPYKISPFSVIGGGLAGTGITSHLRNKKFKKIKEKLLDKDGNLDKSKIDFKKIKLPLSSKTILNPSGNAILRNKAAIAEMLRSGDTTNFDDTTTSGLLDYLFPPSVLAGSELDKLKFNKLKKLIDINPSATKLY